MATRNVTPDSRGKLRDRASSPHINSSPLGGNGGAEGTKERKQIRNRISMPSLKEDDSKGAKSPDSSIKTPKSSGPKQSSKGKEANIYRPPSSLASTPKSRSRSPTVSRTRTPSFHRQDTASTSDRRARQTTLYLNITTSQPPARPPLGALNTGNLQQIPNLHVENSETQHELATSSQLDRSRFVPGPLPKSRFEGVDENRRDSLKQLAHPTVGHSDIPSSPPFKFEFEVNNEEEENGDEEEEDYDVEGDDEEDEDEELQCDDAWLKDSLLLYTRKADKGGKNEDDPPAFLIPPEADTPPAADFTTGKIEAQPLPQCTPQGDFLPLPESKAPRGSMLPKITDTPQKLSFLSNDEAFDLHGAINFDNPLQWGHIIQLHELYKERCVKFDSLPTASYDSWFTPAIANRPVTLRQRWKNCTKSDSHLLRDLHCAFYAALRNVLAVLKVVGSESIVSTPSGWIEICVPPIMLIDDMKETLKWSDETIEALRAEFGLDLSRFIETQLEVKSMSYLRKPSIDFTDNQSGCGYFLTCKKTEYGRYKLQISPPYIQAYCLIERVNNEFEFGKDSGWLCWDSEGLYFRGVIPHDHKISEDPSGHCYITIEITAERFQYFTGNGEQGSHTFYFQESITSRSYGSIPMEAEQPPAVMPIVYPPNPLQSIWDSHKLGFNKRHSKFVVDRIREYEHELYQDCRSEEANNFAADGTFPWDPKEPKIQSWGEVTWCDFLQQKKARAEYFMKNPKGRMEVVRNLGKRPLYAALEFECSRDDQDIDEDLEEMRRMYENLNNEAHAIVWLNTLYRETMQNRLEDESLEMEKVGLRNREAFASRS
ncbi:hypothetical protein TWF730_009436 [Orbilia blumenaviensis]|uniref:Uncharacterized protein n=1 Tax=Orbilia blumenaviensis TaxID=1796055 RepID=A0AAV9UYA3_9PEZI